MESNSFDKQMLVLIEEMLPFDISIIEKFELLEENIILIMLNNGEEYYISINKFDKEDYKYGMFNPKQNL